MTPWQSINLGAVGNDPVVASLMCRTDGVGLLYPGRVHWLFGEPESLKSLLAQATCHQVLAAGGSVLYLDFEDDGQSFRTRLAALGVDDSVLLDRKRVAYIPVDEPFEEDARGQLWAELGRTAPTLVVVDGVTEALALEGLDGESATAVAQWVADVLRYIASHPCVPAILVLDHVVKNPITRGRWPAGSHHKLAAVTGAAYQLKRPSPASR